MTSLRKQPAPKRILAGFVGLTLATSLAGCSNDDDSDALEVTTDASVEETTEYLPASEDGPAQNVPEPRLPAVATENSEEGAEATLQYFWEAEQYARLTGDTDPIAMVSSENCDFCQESIQGWEQSFADGYWAVLHGELQIEITKVETAVEDELSQPVAHIFFQFDEPATDFYNGEGSQTEESFDAPEVKDWFTLLLYDATSQRWEVESLALEESVTWEDE